MSPTNEAMNVVGLFSMSFIGLYAGSMLRKAQENLRKTVACSYI
jgi:hypothetical protein